MQHTVFKIPEAEMAVLQEIENLHFLWQKQQLPMGVDGLFFEIHPQPENALCDGPNSLRLADFENNLPKLIELHAYLNS